MIDDASDTQWSVLLGQMLVAKQAIAEADPRQLEPFAPPRSKATEAQISAFEARVGEPLPAAYREFLSYADGWPLFYFDMDLFGLDELSGGGQQPLAVRLLNMYDAEEVLDGGGLRRGELLPVAAGRGMRHLVVIVRPGGRLAGQVVWIDAEEVGRYRDFFAFFSHMTELKQRRARSLRGL